MGRCMGWQPGSTFFGAGLAFFMWVSPMMGIIIPQWMLPLLLSLSILLMLVWPVNAAIASLFADKKKRFIVYIRVWSVLGLVTILGAYRLPLVTTTVDPATYIEVTDAVPFPEMFKPADTTKINVYFANKGPLPAKDVTFGAVLAIRYPSITKPQEDEMFNDLLKNHKGTPKGDMGVGNGWFRTIQTSMLSKKEADDLQSENTRLYLVGFIHYRDKNGQQTHEFCRWLQPPQKGSPSVWHLCDGGHNRIVSGDTPY